MKNECVLSYAPDYVVTIFWIFSSVIMLSIIFFLITLGLNALIVWYQDKRRDYLELKLLEKQKDGIQS